MSLNINLPAVGNVTRGFRDCVKLGKAIISSGIYARDYQMARSWALAQTPFVVG
ncbi:MAG: hypothetical protein PF517_06870 [Salinivirgaceae bacterium]|nr:hypothetical protein [Salinivirgaceae bacterium]